MGLFSNLLESVSSNIVIRSYNVTDGQTFRIGFENLWEVQHVKCKKTSQDACLFTFDKKNLERYPKTLHSNILELIMYGARVMQTFNHPSIVKILMPICDSKDIIAFSTDHFVGCANSQKSINKSELLLNFTQILNAYDYVHKNFGMSLGYISADNIVTTVDNSWKLCCLDFISQNDAKNQWISKIVELDSYQMSFNSFYIKQNGNIVTNMDSDIFNLFTLILYYFNINDRNFYVSFSSPSSHLSLQCQLKQQSCQYYNNIPPEFVEMCVAVFSQSLNKVKNVQEILKNPVFQTVDMTVLKTISIFDILHNNEKREFSQLFLSLIDKVNLNIVEKKVLPVYLNNISTFSHILEVVIAISKLPISQETFNLIYNKISTLFDVNDDEVKLQFIKNYSFFIEKLHKPENNHSKLINLLKSGLSSRSHEIQLASLQALKETNQKEFIISNIFSIYPSLKECLTHATKLDVQVNSIIAISDTFKYIKNSYSPEEITSILSKIQVTEPATALCIIGAYKSILENSGQNLNSMTIATVIIPSIFRNTQLTKFTKQQIDMQFKLIHKFIDLLHQKMSSTYVSDQPLSTLRSFAAPTEQHTVPVIPEPQKSIPSNPILSTLRSFAVPTEQHTVPEPQKNVPTNPIPQTTFNQNLIESNVFNLNQQQQQRTTPISGNLNDFPSMFVSKNSITQAPNATKPNCNPFASKPQMYDFTTDLTPIMQKPTQQYNHTSSVPNQQPITQNYTQPSCINNSSFKPHLQNPFQNNQQPQFGDRSQILSGYNTNQYNFQNPNASKPQSSQFDINNYK